MTEARRRRPETRGDPSRSASPSGRGGSPASSTRSTRARSPIPTATAPATSAASSTDLDHLSWLGVDAIWLSPVFRSPMRDFGYDISDYCDVDPVFGTLADLDALVEEAHRRGIRVILDFVPNHTSDQHPWFVESRARAHERRGATGTSGTTAGTDGSPPNNWLGMFGGSAWAWDEPTRQFFYHAFLPEQPDLNWRNPAVRAAMYDVLRFWLDRGVDGFRIDVITHLLEDEQLRDNPPNPRYRLGQPTGGVAAVHPHGGPAGSPADRRRDARR